MCPLAAIQQPYKNMVKQIQALISLIFFLFLAACTSHPNAVEATASPSASPLPPAISTATDTPQQAVALINGDFLSAESYELSLSLYKAALANNGIFLATDGIEQIVLDDLIARTLLAQAAREAGFTATNEIVEQCLQSAIDQAGGQSAYEEWLARYGFSDASFRSELSIEIEAAWMRNEIVNAVPTHADQVEARQILLIEEFQAQRLLGQLLDGTPFETVVINNDPQGLGYLGWFPRGFLLQLEVEDAAFALEIGDFSQIVSTDIGFHLIEILDRDENRELNPQARLELQRQAMAKWIADQRQQSEIEVFLPN
jgi:parvulin-like peptidyl-prolyl isomerase